MNKKWMKKLLVPVAAACMMLSMSITAFAFVDESAAAEEATEPVIEETEPSEEIQDAFSVDGNAEVLDDITDASTKEFFTIKTANGNTFFLIIDRSSSTDNVYMLSMIDEYDLQDFIEEEETIAEETQVPSVVLEETEPETSVVETEATEPEETGEGGGLNVNILLLVLLVAIAGAGAFFYFKIFKPANEDEAAESENLELGDGLETENEDEESKDAVDDPDDYDDDGGDE